MRGGFPITIALVASLLACAPAEDEPSDDAMDTGAEPSPEAAGTPAPSSFAETAWRVTSEDGARYTTMLDADGTYRDSRNGDPWQEGDWTYADGPSGKQLCLKPDHEDGLERCWQPEKIKGDTMVATGPTDRRIELLKVEYIAPEAVGDEAEE